MKTSTLSEELEEEQGDPEFTGAVFDDEAALDGYKENYK